MTGIPNSTPTGETPARRPRIVVGVDGSEHSKLALRWAARIAAAEGAQLDAVTAWHYPAYTGYAVLPAEYAPQQEFAKLLTETVDEVFGDQRPEGLRLRTVEGAAAAVLLAASRDALMTVVGSRGHGGFAGLLLGSVSSAVAEHAGCPVLVVHGGSEPPEQP